MKRFLLSLVFILITLTLIIGLPVFMISVVSKHIILMVAMIIGVIVWTLKELCE